MDNTWVYPNSTQLAAVSLTDDIPSLLPVKNDTVEVESDEEESESGDEEPSDQESEESDVRTVIQFDGFESRITMLPVPAGNIGGLMTFDGKVAYMRYPNSGSAGGPPALQAYDFEEQEEITIMEGVSGAVQSADGKSILVSAGNQYGIIQPQAGQSIDQPISTDGLVMQLVVRDEWNQIFQDTWRRYRDFFYDPNMHEVDWEEMRERYGDLIADARTRQDITYLQSNM
jgi:tricorn protease